MGILKNRTPMPHQDPQERRKNFDEVALGFCQEDALKEAGRCLQCKDSPCVGGCPVATNIPGFIKAITENDMPRAIKIIKENNFLPAITGRVCPQESQCECRCTMGKKYEPVSIGRLERYAADWERANGLIIPELPPPTGKKIGIVGSGPAGLTAAAYLAKKGHKVKVFEALHEPGGVLSYGIPSFRIPREAIRAEVEYVKSLGVEVETDTLIGRTISLDDLKEMGFDSIFIGTGAGLPRFMNIPGENLNGIYSGNEFLFRINLMKSYLFPEYDTPIKVGKKVVVIGSGNVAMDCARCAKRLGSDVKIIYRRSRKEMPARHEEVVHAEEEGIEFSFLTTPIRYIGDTSGNIKKLVCSEMELCEPDGSGRRKPRCIEGTEFELPVDNVIIAIGQSPNPLISMDNPDIETSGRGTIVVDKKCQTSRMGVYAGGDITTGQATVIAAMGAGKRAAEAMHEYLIGEKDKK